MTPTFGLKQSQQFVGTASLRKLWTMTDEAGFDHCWVFDHFVPMGRRREGDIFEAWTLLAAMAAVTRNVRIGCLVTGNTNRHPGVLAKMAVTVDHLSGGRLNFGFGAGGDALADSMLGMPTPPAGERLDRLAEALTVLDLLWSKPVADFDGRHYTLTQALSDPKPVQAKLPVWLGSSGERRGLRIVAEHADVWLNACMPGTELAELRRLSAVLDRHCADVGRDVATIRHAVQFRLPPTVDETLREAEAFIGAGFTDLIFMPIGEDALHATETATKALPRLRELG